MDKTTREHLRRMLQHASIAGKAHAFDRLAVDLQTLLDAPTETRSAPVVEQAAVEEVAPVVEAAPVVEEVAPVKATPKPKRRTRARRRAKGTAVEQPAVEEEAAAPAADKPRKTKAVRAADAPAAVESALGTVAPDASGTLADLFPAEDEQEAGA